MTMCATCGRPIRPGRVRGTWMHAAATVAACDLDADHEPVPAEAPPPEVPADGTGTG